MRTLTHTMNLGLRSHNSDDVWRAPPQLVDYYDKMFDIFLSTLPDTVLELDKVCQVVLMTKHGRRFLVSAHARMFLKNRMPMLAVFTVYASPQAVPVCFLLLCKCLCE